MANPHLVGWRATAQTPTSLTAFARVAGETLLTADGANRWLVPKGINYIRWAIAGGATLTRAQIVTPSLGRRRMNLDINPINGGAIPPTVTAPQIWLPPKPVALDEIEDLELDIITSGSGTVAGFVQLGPQALPPIPEGDIREVRGTATATLTAGALTAVTLTLDNALEAGLYALVHFLPLSATCQAARAVDPSGGFRPGMPGLALATTAAPDFDPTMWDRVGWYEMFRFAHNQVPQFEFMAGSADTAETVWLYVVKVG